MSATGKKEVKRFGDLSPSQVDVEEMVVLDYVLGKEIIIHDFVEREGSFGEFVVVVASLAGDNARIGFTTGGKVVVRKLKEARDQGYLPLPGRIERVKRYYDIV